MNLTSRMNRHRTRLAKTALAVEGLLVTSSSDEAEIPLRVAMRAEHRAGRITGFGQAKSGCFSPADCIALKVHWNL
jgi:hypothetical protein